MKLTKQTSNQCKDLLKLLKEQKQVDQQFREAIQACEKIKSDIDAIINYQTIKNEKERSPKL